MKPHNHIDGLDRRLNHIDAEGMAVSAQITAAQKAVWPDYAIAPLVKIRAALRREYVYVSGLKNKREAERAERTRLVKLDKLQHKFNDKRK